MHSSWANDITCLKLGNVLKTAGSGIGSRSPVQLIALSLDFCHNEVMKYLVLTTRPPLCPSHAWWHQGGCALGFAHGTQCGQWAEQLLRAKSLLLDLRLKRSRQEKNPFLGWPSVTFGRPDHWCTSTLVMKKTSLPQTDLFSFCCQPYSSLYLCQLNWKVLSYKFSFYQEVFYGCDKVTPYPFLWWTDEVLLSLQDRACFVLFQGSAGSPLWPRAASRGPEGAGEPLCCCSAPGSHHI